MLEAAAVCRGAGARVRAFDARGGAAMLHYLFPRSSPGAILVANTTSTSSYSSRAPKFSVTRSQCRTRRLRRPSKQPISPASRRAYLRL